MWRTQSDFIKKGLFNTDFKTNKQSNTKQNKHFFVTHITLFQKVVELGLAAPLKRLLSTNDG